MIYFIADTHMGHYNIIKYENRPFISVQEMNQYMINTWNKIIKPNDMIYHIGDFGLGKSQELINLGQQLNGKKILIKGNHDKRNTNTFWRRCGFEKVYNKLMIKENNQKFILTHVPLLKIPKNYINLYGHVHTINDRCSNSYCVSVENIDYKPISLEEVLNELNI